MPIVANILPGRSVGVFGPKGSGKTTCLKSLIKNMAQQHDETIVFTHRVESYADLVGAHRLVKLDHKTFDAELRAITDRYKFYQEKASKSSTLTLRTFTQLASASWCKTLVASRAFTTRPSSWHANIRTRFHLVFCVH